MYHEWINLDANVLPTDKTGLIVNIGSWYPCWVVVLMIRYRIWKNK